MNSVDEVIDKIFQALKDLPIVWEGRASILQMKDSDYPHWRQMEWIGFYFQFLCDKHLADVLKIPGKRFGRAEFDGYQIISWDFKAHPNLKSDGKPNLDVIVNDKEAILAAVEESGSVGLILAVGETTYNDVDGSFKKWHENLKGAKSDYTKKREKRNAPSRLRKTKFVLKRIDIIVIGKENEGDWGDFQKGMRNSNGKLRRSKVSLDLKKHAPTRSIDF